ncbi:transglutaminaseTgpA domain-containing protein [Nocardioides sp. SOB77]|uniref:TransglutaminaseTgpA domain-containing protein n=1 Tax=Nocardioides oceani TaxID=3058369 RepID=A0ABT8FFT2_9ACTN|nr:transglutaminaseTgpA domain-containing protein [Nocardioides oceani]MDN4173022.1 transglutaminaseTgpA domain-containing protein [Nocardioides oceani]
MTTRRASLRTTLAVSAAAAATTWVAMLSWRPFTELPGRFLGPLALIGLVVVATGALARWARLPGGVVVLAQLLTGGVATSLALTGYPLPLGPGAVALEAVFRAAVDSANQYAPPVPSTAPGVHPLLVSGGLACFLLVDVLVSTLRRVSLAGLPLLTIYSVPVSLVGGGLSWWVFALTATGFLLVLYLHEGDRVTRWGRTVEEDPTAFDVRTGRVRATALAIGALATALAVAVPIAVPTLDVRLVDFGHGPGGDDDIELSNPLADLKQDLVRGPDDPVLRFTTDDPDPSYLRTTALTWFNGDTWSAGDREVPTTNLAAGQLPPLLGVESGLDRRTYDYRVSVYENFESSWLPAWATSTLVDAPGDWRYDVQTRDFLAADDDLDTRGLQYRMLGVELDYDAVDMARAPSVGGLVPSTYTELPDGLPTEVRNLAIQVTREAPTRYEKAVALQRWFRETGGFEYTTDGVAGNDIQDLVSFLRPDGRRGYCEQYAASMAIMARMLGIPARVAVGFLRPQRVGTNTWEYSAHDLHAWPELFFPGSGWVRFEPTPAARARTVPQWTRQDVPAPDPGSPDRTEGAAPDTPDRAADQPAAPVEEEQPEEAAGAGDDRAWLLPVLGGLLGAGALAVLLLLPRLVRTRRRARRLSAGPEPAWAELRDTAVDLGLRWPVARSPRQTRDWLVQHFGARTDEYAAPRPPRGPELAPDAVHALDRVVASLELRRYSPRGEDATATLRAEVETVTEALHDGASRGARRLAAWWPRSVLTRQAGPAPRSTTEPGQTRYGGVVDHVGT